jgi:hypothetical protein
MYHLQQKVCSSNSKNSCLLGFGHDTVCGGPDTAPPDARTSPQVPTHPHYRGVSPVRRELQHKSHAATWRMFVGGCVVTIQALSALAMPPEARSFQDNLHTHATMAVLEGARGRKCVRHLPESLYTAATPLDILKIWIFSPPR